MPAPGHRAVRALCSGGLGVEAMSDVVLVGSWSAARWEAGHGLMHSVASKRTLGTSRPLRASPLVRNLRRRKRQRHVTGGVLGGC